MSIVIKGSEILCGLREMLSRLGELRTTDDGVSEGANPEAKSVSSAEVEKPKGVLRSKKLSIYLTPTVYKGIKDMGELTNRKVSSVIYDVLTELVESKTEELKEYREFIGVHREARGGSSWK